MSTADELFSSLIARLNMLKTEGWPEFIPHDVAFVLQDVWAHLHKADSKNLHVWKLTRGRIEDPVWEPPVFTFSIERHGAAKYRSTRAEMQVWKVDLEKRRAEIIKKKHRQLKPMSPRYNPTEDCQKIVAMIRSGKEHAWLKWSPGKDRVRINIGLVVSGNAPKQTITGRRKRFRAKLAEMLQDCGWENKGNYNTYEKRLPLDENGYSGPAPDAPA